MSLSKLFRAPHFDDPEVTRAAAVLAPLLTCVSFALVLVMVSSLTVDWVMLWQQIGIAIATVVFVAMRWMVQQGRVRIAAGTTTLLLLAMSTSSMLNDASSAVFPVSFAIAITIGGFTTRRPGPLWLGALVAAGIFAAHYGHEAGLITLRRAPEPVGIALVQAICLVVLAAGVHWMNQALENARDHAVAQEETARELEQGLFRAQRMEAIGRLAGGVAHDFNNLLTVVMANASTIYESEGLSDVDRESCEAIIKASEGGANLTRQLLAFGGRQVVAPKRLELADVVSDFRPVLEHMKGKDARLTLDAPAGLGSVRVDPGQMQHAVANLVINAAHASTGGSTIAIKIELVRLSEDRVASHGTIPAGTYQVLRVRDEGRGMEKETVLHAFEPFYSANAHVEGSGLGLAVVHGVVAQGGGHAEIESVLGRGTTVSLWLPVVAGAPLWRRSTIPPRVTDALVGMRVLLVDDDHGARRAVRLLLEGAGAKVSEAADADSALACVDAEAAFCVAILDVIMPGTSGPVLAGLLRTQGFAAPIVFLTGFVDPDEFVGEMGPGATVLYKPVTAVDLVRALTRGIRVATG